MKKMFFWIIVIVIIVLAVLVFSFGFKGNFFSGISPTFNCNLDFEEENDACLDNYGLMLENCTKSLFVLSSEYMTYDVDIQGLKGGYCYIKSTIIKSPQYASIEGKSMTCKINLESGKKQGSFGVAMFSPAFSALPMVESGEKQGSFGEGMDVLNECEGELKDALIELYGSIRESEN